MAIAPKNDESQSGKDLPTKKSMSVGEYNELQVTHRDIDEIAKEKENLQESKRLTLKQSIAVERKEAFKPPLSFYLN